jgi:hypothetical protein
LYRGGRRCVWSGSRFEENIRFCCLIRRRYNAMITALTATNAPTATSMMFAMVRAELDSPWAESNEEEEEEETVGRAGGEDETRGGDEEYEEELWDDVCVRDEDVPGYEEDAALCGVVEEKEDDDDEEEGTTRGEDDEEATAARPVEEDGRRLALIQAIMRPMFGVPSPVTASQPGAQENPPSGQVPPSIPALFPCVMSLKMV